MKNSYFVKIVMIGCVLFAAASPASAQYDNDLYAVEIAALIAAHNVAFPASLVPGPVGIGAGFVTYSSNLGLKYVPPLLEAPPAIGVYPNFAADGGEPCGYQFNMVRNEANFTDLYGFITSFPGQPSDWGYLGAPTVYHANTDARVRVYDSLLNGGTLLPTGNQVFPVGKNAVVWEAETLISYPLDVVIPVMLMTLAPLKETTEGKEFILNALEAAGLVVAGALVDPTPHADGQNIVNRQVQSFDVYDEHPPEISLTQSTPLRIQATSPGGLTGADALIAANSTVSISDRCGRRVDVTKTVADFLTLGEHTIAYRALDDGPNPALQGDQRNETIVEQTIIVEDTVPPALVPPPDIVIESAGPAQVQLGSPLVFDAVDLSPTVSCDAGADCFAPIEFPLGQTAVNWTATDFAGQSAAAVQYVTVKVPGTNTAPVADDQLADQVRSFESVDLELTGTDADGDRLAFRLVDQPDNGFFVAPLYPYFVEDFRLEAGPNPMTLEQRCDALPHGVFTYDLEYPRLPSWLAVNDDGRTYVYDQGLIDCNGYLMNSNVDPTSRQRIAVFDVDGALINSAEFPNTFNDMWIDDDGMVHIVSGTGGSGLVTRYTPDLDVLAVYKLQQATGSGFNATCVYDLKSAVIDSNGLIYAINRACRDILVFDSNVPPQPGSNVVRPVYLGILAEYTAQGDVRLEIDGKNRVYASVQGGHRIYRYEPSGLAADGSLIAGTLDGWLGKCTGDLNPGLVTHCDVANQRSIGFSCTDATCSNELSLSGSEPGQFASPKGIAIDPNDVLYVTDFDNQRVQRFTPEGFAAGIAESDCASNCFVLGQFGRPEDISVNSTRFYILDKFTELLHVSETSPIKEVRPTSVIVEYSSDNNFVGTDSFTFQATDGLRIDGELVMSNLATVTIPVVRNDRPPVANVGIAATTAEDTPIAITLDGSDPDEFLDVITFVIDTPPSHGTLSGTGANRIYTPNPDFYGDDEFSFRLNDGVNDSAPEPVAITVTPVNDAPVIDTDSMIMLGLGYEGTVVARFTDPDDTDRHLVTVDWGDGTIEPEGDALPDGTITGPLLQEGIGNHGSIVGRHVYTSLGDYTVEVCITDQIVVDVNGNKMPTPASATSCATTTAEVAQRALVVTDIAPSATSIVDGDDIDYVLTLQNVAPTSGGLDATDVVLSVTVDDGVEIASVASPACDVVGQVVTCTYDTLASGSGLQVSIEAATSGQALIEQRARIVAEVTMNEPNLAPISVNAREVVIALNPLGDADGDGVPNADDAFPNDPNESTDTDGDGIGNVADLDDDGDFMPDAWEERFGLDPLSADTGADTDGDGLGDIDEYLAGSDPRNADTDNDGLADGADNCPTTYDATQHDSNGNGRGDVCDLASTAAALAIADVDNDGNDDYAVLRSSATGTTLWLGNNTGEWLQTIDVLTPAVTALDMSLVSDLDGNETPGVAVLAEDAFGSTRVSLVNSAFGTLQSELSFFDPSWIPAAVAELPGGGVAGESALAVLASNVSGGLRIELRSASDGSLLETIDALSAGWRAVDLAVLSDGTLAILAQADDGNIRVALSLPDGTLNEIPFLDTTYRAMALAVSETDEVRLAVLADDAGSDTVLEVRTIDGVQESYIAMDTVLDVTTLTTDTLALLTADNLDGTLRIVQRSIFGPVVAQSEPVLVGALAPRNLISAHNADVAALGSDSAGHLHLQLVDAVSGAIGSTLTTSPATLIHSYYFNGNLSDSIGMLPIVENGGTIVDGRYEFQPNLGLTLTGGLERTDNYTIEMLFELDETTTPFYIKLVDFENLSSDFGLYLRAAALRFYPLPDSGPQTLTANTDYLLVMTVEGDTTNVYLDGVLQLSRVGAASIAPTNVLNFFIDDLTTGQSEAQSGSIDYLQIYDGAMTLQQVAQLTPPAQDDPDFDGDGWSDTVDNCTVVANAAQIDTDGDGYGNRCDPDYNNDGIVNFIDLNLLRTPFFGNDPNFDLDGDGNVNFADLQILESMFFGPPGPSALSQ